MCKYIDSSMFIRSNATTAFLQPLALIRNPHSAPGLSLACTILERAPLKTRRVASTSSLLWALRKMSPNAPLIAVANKKSWCCLSYPSHQGTSFQLPANAPAICRLRSRIVRCSSAPSTSLLSVCENDMTILFFLLSAILSSMTIMS